MLLFIIFNLFVTNYILSNYSTFRSVLVVNKIWDKIDSDVAEGEKRVIISFRAVGEGHISSIVFRRAVLDIQNNIVFSKSGRTIALLGVSDLIVVETPDALLVCHRHEAEKIKQLVAMVPPELQ